MPRTLKSWWIETHLGTHNLPYAYGMAYHPGIFRHTAFDIRRSSPLTAIMPDAGRMPATTPPFAARCDLPPAASPPPFSRLRHHTAHARCFACARSRLSRYFPPAGHLARLATYAGGHLNGGTESLQRLALASKHSTCHTWAFRRATPFWILLTLFSLARALRQHATKTPTPHPPSPLPHHLARHPAYHAGAHLGRTRASGRRAQLTVN